MHRLPAHFSTFVQIVQNRKQIPRMDELYGELLAEETNSKLRSGGTFMKRPWLCEFEIFSKSARIVTKEAVRIHINQ
jgi:hypothetical protein